MNITKVKEKTGQTIFTVAAIICVIAVAAEGKGKGLLADEGKPCSRRAIVHSAVDGGKCNGVKICGKHLCVYGNLAANHHGTAAFKQGAGLRKRADGRICRSASLAAASAATSAT